MFVLLSSSSPFFIIVTSHPIICALQTFLVALSMSLFFDSIIQNYFTGIKIVYINYGFFFNYQYIFRKTLHEGKYFQWIQEMFWKLITYNLNKCIPVWSIEKCQLFHKELSTQLKSFLKQCVEWSLMFNQFYLFIKGVGGMSKLWCSANSGTKWTITLLVYIMIDLDLISIRSSTSTM